YNVSFESADVPSGKITLFGTIFIPDTASSARPVPGCVLIHGSGGNNRWEEGDGVRVFEDIAIKLATNGVAVLVYDKRNCHISPCMYQFCRDTTNNCVQSLKLSLYDFLSDAQQAFYFLANYSNRIDSNKLYIMGHSEGVTIGINLALNLLERHSQPSPKGLVLLMGVGVDFDLVLEYQAKVQQPLFEKYLLDLRSQTSVTPQISAEILRVTEILNVFNCITNVAVEQYNLIRQNRIPIDYSSIICYSGATFPATNVSTVNVSIQHGFYCPAKCGTSICSKDLNIMECLIQCQISYSFDTCLSTAWANSQLQLGNDKQLTKSLEIMKRNNVSIMSINSQTDLKVPPVVYQPLLQLIEKIYEKKSIRLFLNEVDGLTHSMTSKTSARNVDPIITEKITKFIEDLYVELYL
ncbi:unnamed protein product, partial [Didymodactylos carnosus]